MRKIIVAWTGASGIIYGARLVDVLLQAGCEVHLAYSAPASLVYEEEIGLPPAVPDLATHLRQNYGATSHLVIHDNNRLTSPIASGSFRASAMVVVPCSMSTVSAIAVGAADSLIKRAADVMLKEKQPLILVPRETPLSLIHLRNLTVLAEAGATILPAMPGFYHHPQEISGLVDFVVGKIMDQLGIDHTLFQRYEPDIV